MRRNIVSEATEVLREEGIRSLFGRVPAYIVRRLGVLALHYALHRIKSLNRDCSLDDSLDFVFHDCARLIAPGQLHAEISELLKIVDRIKPKVILEIGTANGGTLFLFSRVACGDAIIISIDLPGGEFGGGYPAWRTRLYESFALPDQEMYLLRADSHKIDTLEQVRDILGGREIDFLFIDGDHTYKGVKTDFEMYAPLVRGGGIVAFHDITPGRLERVGGVPQFWNEIKGYYWDKERELVHNRNQKGFGIGLLYPTGPR
jgi:predicted O-methyltransferase YrrM